MYKTNYLNLPFAPSSASQKDALEYKMKLMNGPEANTGRKNFRNILTQWVSESAMFNIQIQLCSQFKCGLLMETSQ